MKFGREMRTPAMQAGLAKRRLSFREIFTSAAVILLIVLIVIAHVSVSDAHEGQTAAA